MQLITILGLASLATAWPATVYSGADCDGDEMGTIDIPNVSEECQTPENLGGSMLVDGFSPNEGEFYLYEEGDCGGDAVSGRFSTDGCISFKNGPTASFFLCKGVCY